MLRIHFLNVGHGDCTIIEFVDSSRIAMVDINHTDDMDRDTINEILDECSYNVNPEQKLFLDFGLLQSGELLKSAGYDIKLQDPVEFIKERNIKAIFRFISTHPHTDHLSGLHKLYSNVNINNIWIIKNKFSPVFKKLNKNQLLDWLIYLIFRNCADTKYQNTKIVRPLELDSNDFWAQDGISVLSPNLSLLRESIKNNNPNTMSYVLLINYFNHKIILGGDAEENTWEYIYNNHSQFIKDTTILKASHHGRDSGYHQKSVKLMNPQYTIVSVGKKPKSDATNKYRQYCDNVWSTRWHGNIVFELESDGSGTYFLQYD